MGTSGYLGFYYFGKFFICYNHYDHNDIYNDLIREILTNDLDMWREKLKKIIIVNENIIPTSNDIEKLKKYTNLNVSSKSQYDWYCLLRETQGSFVKILDSGYILIDNNFEYTYICNLDDNTFDIYSRKELVSSTSFHSMSLRYL